MELLEKGSESRVEIKRQKASAKKRSAEKKSRRKYRNLAEQRGRDAVGEQVQDESPVNEDRSKEDQDNR